MKCSNWLEVTEKYQMDVTIPHSSNLPVDFIELHLSFAFSIFLSVIGVYWYAIMGQFICDHKKIQFEAPVSPGTQYYSA